MTRSARRLAAAAGLLAAVSGAARAEIAPGSLYVAMGSSYAAGTSLPREANDGVPRCGQGDGNYPRQVARALKLTLVDRSCGGAVTPHLLTGGQFDLPAQVAAVTADTRLVTITIGGNDVRFVADLGLAACRQARSSCTPPPAGFELEGAFAKLDGDLRALVAEVRRRAPRARIVFVDYVAVVPAEGTCAALGMSAEDAAALRARAARLATLTARVASEEGADLIKASDLSRGHDVCAGQPWAWGYVTPEERARTGAAGFHPRPEAIDAIARAIVARLGA